MSISKIVEEQINIVKLASYFHSGEETDLLEVKYYLLSSHLEVLQAELSRKKGMVEKTNKTLTTWAYEEGKQSIIQEDITYLEEQIELIKKSNL
jgi:hypothetical protein